MSGVDEGDALRRGFKISSTSNGKTYVSPMGPTLLISALSSGEVATLQWAFRVGGNSSWSVGLISDDAKGRNDELFQRGKIGLDSNGLCGGTMPSTKMHGKLVEVTYEARTGQATFKIEGIRSEIKMQNPSKGIMRLALSTFCDTKVHMLTGPPEQSSIRVGSRVQVKPSVSKPKYGWGSVSHSSIGTVTSIDDDGDVIVNFPIQARWNGILEEMQSVCDSSSPSASNVKVGDKLRIVSSIDAVKKACEDHGGFVDDMKKYLGKCLTVTNVQTDRVRLKADGESDGYVWGWAAVQFDSEFSKKESRELKVGDRVKLAKLYKQCGDAKNGPLKAKETGTIIEVDDSSQPLNVRTTDGRTWWYTRAAVVAESRSDSDSPDGSDEEELSAGDFFKLSKTYRRHSDAKLGPLKPGDVGILTQVNKSSRPYLVSKDGSSWWYDRQAIVSAEFADEGSDSENGTDDEGEERSVPADWGACHISGVSVSSGSGAEHLINGRTSDYWESCGEADAHFILVSLKRPSFLHELGIIVDPSCGDSYCPEKVRVLVGTDPSDLRDLGVQTHRVGALRGVSYLRLASVGDRAVSVIRIKIEGSGKGSCGQNCRVVGVCVRCGEGRRVDETNCAIGLEVARGPDWMWGDQDGGAGRLGLLTEIDGEGWATVMWEAGTTGVYRVGEDGCYDLALASSAADSKSAAQQVWKHSAGKKHINIQGVRGSLGPRWEISGDSSHRCAHSPFLLEGRADPRHWAEGTSPLGRSSAVLDRR